LEIGLANPFFEGRTLIVAFEGWNDAAEGASGLVKHLVLQLDADVIAAVDPEDYYDFQFSRPTVANDEVGQREISWPGAELLRSSKAAAEENPRFSDLFFLLGNEPARRWKTFSAEIMEFIEDCEIDQVIFLGAVPSDSPHTRSIKVSRSSQSATIRKQLAIEPSDYEGPVGIISVLAMSLEEAGIPSVALWAPVPHYVHNSPSPKATFALLVELETLLGLQFNHGTLADDAFAWERGIDELAENDEDLAAYVNQLESARDAADESAGSAESLALEFERFLAQEDEGKD
jgi:proteasome assembly chaperone (PAC2) family protein